MTDITLDQARKIITVTLDKAGELGLKPMAVAVLDKGGHLKAFEKQDGASNLRFELAFGKANGALAMGIGSRALFQRAEQQPYFVNAVNALADGALVPVPGGVLIKDAGGAIMGAVGVTGDTSDNDETCAIAGIGAVGLVADPG
ncbi:MAG: glcg protein [Rhodospirillaceae bacterium]|nr:glcg protein [Rhodospirillaceae bacterium]